MPDPRTPSDGPAWPSFDTSQRGYPPSITIRVDASTVMGSGHVMRCLTLADELRRSDADVTFVSRHHDGHLLALIEGKGYAVQRLPASQQPRVAADGDYAAWLGVSQAQDAAETIAAVGKRSTRTDWIIVDHYGLDRTWEMALRPFCDRILAIDDVARSHECDALLDQNWHGDCAAGRYAHRVPTECVLLLGPRFALLRSEYRDLHASPLSRAAAVSRVLVFFGGSDRWNMNAKALTALSAPECAHLQVDLVVGGTQPLSQHAENLARARKRTVVHRGLSSLAPLVAAADIGIGAVGGSTWERMCAGLPTLAVSIAENQVPAAEMLAREGLIVHAGRADAIGPDVLGAHLRTLLCSSALRERLAISGRALVDGCGAARCCRHILRTIGAHQTQQLSGSVS